MEKRTTRRQTSAREEIDKICRDIFDPGKEQIEKLLRDNSLDRALVILQLAARFYMTLKTVH